MDCGPREVYWARELIERLSVGRVEGTGPRSLSFEHPGTFSTLLSGTKVPLVVDVVMTRLVIAVLACYSSL